MSRREGAELESPVKLSDLEEVEFGSHAMGRVVVTAGLLPGPLGVWMTTKLAACEPVPPVFQTRVSTGAITVKPTGHCALLPAPSVTVTVMIYEPGPTTVPAGGDCEQMSAATGVQSSLKQFLLQKSGMIALHA